MNKATSGFDAIPTPKFYIKIIVEIEALLQEAPAKDKGGKKKMSGAASKGLTNMKQKMRKITKQYEQQIAEYKKDPEAFMQEKEEKEESPVPAKREVASAAATIDESELDGFTSVGKRGKTVVPVTADNIFIKLREVMESRGKKVTIKGGRRKVCVDSMADLEHGS